MHHRIEQKIKKGKAKTSVYISMLFATFHYAFTVYVTSTYLTTWFSDRAVGIIYSLGALASIGALIVVPHLAARIGNQRMTLFAILLEGVALIGLSQGYHFEPFFIASLFVAHIALAGLLNYHLDVFLEERSEDKTTGMARGIFLTTANIAYVITPILSGFLVSLGGFKTAYFVSAAFLVPLFLVVLITLPNHKTTNTPFVYAVTTFLTKSDLRNVFLANLFLYIFYAWMTIYTPLYLSTKVGFTWPEIGVMFSIMLLPFLLFELPLGRIADHFLGEKEIMVTGFLVISIATSVLAFLPASILLWTLFLFLTRVGAAAVEIMIETYFFKKVSGTDTEEIGFFRMTRPFAILLAPAIAGSVLWILSVNGLPFGLNFLALALISFFGIIPALLLHDTK